MKRIVTFVLAITMAMSMATVAFAATVTGKNDVVLGVSTASFSLVEGDAGRIHNDDGNVIPGTKFRVEIIQVTGTDANGNHIGNPISRTAFTRTGADVYFRASKGSKYFKAAELKYTTGADGTPNAHTWAEVELKYPMLSLKDDDIELKLGVKRGSQNDYIDYTDTLENLFIDNLGEDNTDATINKVGTRIKVDDSGFADIINIDFETDDEVFYDVKMYNKDEVFIYLTTDVHRDLAEEFVDIDFDYYFFNQVGNFAAVGTLSLPGNSGDRVYELVTGVPTEAYATFGEDEYLVPVNATWNADDEVLQFRTRNLGRYVVASTELALPEYPNATEPTPETDEEDLEDDREEEYPNRIPETGANGMANAAVAVGVIAMAAAGAYTFKKK